LAFTFVQTLYCSTTVPDGTAEPWLLFLSIFLGFLTVSWLVDWANGWQILVRKYKTQDRLSGSVWYVQQGGTTCSNVTPFYASRGRGSYTIAANEGGFYIRKDLMLVIRSPLLFIPWTEIEEVEKYDDGEGKFFIFRIGMSEKVSMLVPQLPFSEVTAVFEKKIKVRVWNKI
jgi:hypothetical protein